MPDYDVAEFDLDVVQITESRPSTEAFASGVLTTDISNPRDCI